MHYIKKKKHKINNLGDTQERIVSTQLNSLNEYIKKKREKIDEISFHRRKKFFNENDGFKKEMVHFMF